MEITFSFLRSKEVVNLYDGKRLGHILDISLDKESGRVLGFIVPPVKKMFRKNEDIFIPLENIKKIGDDVILVRLSPTDEPVKERVESQENVTYARYRRVPVKEK